MKLEMVGILSIWDPNVFVKNSVVCTNHVVIVSGVWVPFHIHCYMVNVYAPRGLEGKRLLWDYLKSFVKIHGDSYIICGDFNVVRDVPGRFSSNSC